MPEINIYRIFYTECDAWCGNRLEINITPSLNIFVDVTLTELSPKNHRYGVITPEEYGLVTYDILHSRLDCRPPPDPNLYLDGNSYVFRLSSTTNYDTTWSWNVALPPEWAPIGLCLSHLRNLPVLCNMMKDIENEIHQPLEFWNYDGRV